jgi:hypothetical protein
MKHDGLVFVAVICLHMPLHGMDVQYQMLDENGGSMKVPGRSDRPTAPATFEQAKSELGRIGLYFPAKGDNKHCITKNTFSQNPK